MLVGRWLTSLSLLWLAVGCGNSDPSGNPPSPITVAGKVIGLGKQVIPGATVVIGSQHATTDAAGTFSIAGVIPPYDATVIVPAGNRNLGILYKGLTRGDPILLDLVDGSFPNHGKVSGSVSGGDPLMAPLDKTAVAWGSPETTESSEFVTNPWSLSLQWAGSAATTGNIHALQWTPTTGIPTEYRGHGVATGVAVANGGVTSSVAIAMTAPVASTISGSVAVPAGMTLSGRSLWIDFADGATFVVGQEATTATSFQYAVPAGIGSTASVIAAGSGAGAASVTVVKGIAAGSSGTSVGLLAPAIQSTPVINATGVSTSTDFTWTPLTGALHFVTISSTSNTAPGYFLVTTGTTARIPDLSAFGVVLPASTAYSWNIAGMGPWESVDAFASGEGLLPTRGSVQNQSIATPRAFTTQ